MSKEFDVVIIGGGVIGTSLLYILSNYTNVKNIAIIEKYNGFGLVNSNKKMNSQTLHFGDIETNYSLEKAKKVNEGASMVARYLDKYDKKFNIHKRYSKMVLAVGEKEVKELSERYENFKKLFPSMKKIDREEIGKLEPKVVEGRDLNEELLALYSKEGYTVDFGKLSESFVTKSKANIMLNTEVRYLAKEDNKYKIYTNKNEIYSKVVIFATGGHSLMFAKSLGYGLDFAILPVVGNFYYSHKVLNGKVYTMQIPKLPFAAIHGDPEVDSDSMTRFGPTAKVIPVLERRNVKTFIDFLVTLGFSLRGFLALFKVISDTTILKFVLRNFSYDLPFVGKSIFMHNIRKIIPSMKTKDVHFAKGYGGLRPQIIDKKSMSLNLGEAKVFGENIIFNVTPSPGASVCLQSSFEDAKKIITFLGSKYKLNEKRFVKDFS